MKVGFVSVGEMTFNAGGAITEYQRVQRTGTTVTVAGAGDQGIGHAVKGTNVQSGDRVTIRLTNAQGSHIAIADGATAEGAELNGAANGQVTDGAGTAIGAVANNAAGAAGDYIEIVYF